VRELKLLGELPMEEGEWPRYFVGTPSKVKGQLEEMAGELGIGELIVNTIVWDHAKRLRSYELLADVFGLWQKLPSRFVDVDAAVERAYPRG
jgi:alkanesulfonate monooxygenase SsuD/methylene tetrahydromethanopterin reductase-like flavin-dependent oxidoreductase (luciferase family)